MEKLCAQFNLYGISHIVYLLVSIAVVVVLVCLLRKQDKQIRFVTAKVLVGVSALFVVLECVGKIVAGTRIVESLPLNPWSIIVMLAIYVEVKQSDSWIKFGYLISLPVCVVSLFVVPEYFAIAGASSIATISYFVINSLMSAYSLLKFIWADVLLEIRDVINSSVNYIIIIAFVHIFNVLARFSTLGVHSNFFGTMGENYDALVSLLYEWIPVPLVHILPMFAALIGIEFLLYLPFHILITRRRRKYQVEELVALGNMKAQQEARLGSKKTTSQILIRSEEKARPEREKNITQSSSGGFLSVNKEVQVNKDEK